MDSLKVWINDSLSNSRHEVFKDVVQIEVETSSMDDGQIVVISEIKKAAITLVTSSGEKKIINAVVKVESQTPGGKDMASRCDAFGVEIKMYSEVLKSMEKIISESGKEDKFLWPDCYLSGDNKLLLQDLSIIGYKIVPVHKFMDVHHATLVLKSLGQFHAMSLVLRQRSMLNVDDFKCPYYARKLPYLNDIYEMALKTLCRAIKESWGEEWSSIPDRLMNFFSEGIGEILYRCWNETKDKWQVLNHGDFSIRNMLFHYPSNSTIPDDIKFIDFQMCHYSNLANDLILLLYSSLLPQVREDNMDHLLTTYIDSLGHTARMYGYKGHLPTVQDVRAAIKSLSPLLILYTIVSITAAVQSGKEDLQEKASNFFQETRSEAEINSDSKTEKVPLFLNFFDEDVIELLKMEIQTCLNDKLF